VLNNIKATTAAVVLVLSFDKLMDMKEKKKKKITK